MRVFVPVALILIAGCSSQPSQQATTATPEPARTVVAMANPAPATATVATAEADEFKPPAGYKRQVENGQIYYCTKIVVLGSRFPKDDCRTQAELEQLQRDKESQRNSIEQQRALCGSAAGCANP